jgi:hypothetical protein
MSSAKKPVELWVGGGYGTQSTLSGPTVDSEFEKALNELVHIAKSGHKVKAEFNNPNDDWIRARLRIFQDFPEEKKQTILAEASSLYEEAVRLNSEGKAAARAWPDAGIRLDSGGFGFFSQLGVARRPDLTQYFVDGFPQNRDSLSFSTENQKLFAEIFPYISKALADAFEKGDTVVQTDRLIGDFPDNSYHARQLLFGDHYLHLPYMWKQLTFDISLDRKDEPPEILEISLPNWLEDLALPTIIRDKIKAAGLMQLVLKAPTKGLSMHLGFDYLGEHKMGPLSIAMFKVKQEGGLAIQAALSVARVRGHDAKKTNIAVVTPGPSLHGKSTLTIMLDFVASECSKLLSIKDDLEEGVYPMNDDIIMLRPMDNPQTIRKSGNDVTITHSIEGAENNFYAVPFGLTREDDPITYDVCRGEPGNPNTYEIMENVPIDPVGGIPNTLSNPVRNMRMILSRARLLKRKGVDRILESVTGGSVTDAVHVPMESIDAIFWQGVMRQNTVLPPLIRLTCEGYIRALMFGEAVQTGAAIGAIGRPYVEYFSDPFIIGIEDENANAMYGILKHIAVGGMNQSYTMFNTGGVGADNNESTSGSNYKKITREITLMLQEALLRGALKFEIDDLLGVEVAVAVINDKGEEVLDLRTEWLPREIYGVEEYRKRVLALKRTRYYGENSQDRAGILRYTKVDESIFDLEDIPFPQNEREMAWILSFYWSLDRSYDEIALVLKNLNQGNVPRPEILITLSAKIKRAIDAGLVLPEEAYNTLNIMGL